MLRGTYRRTLYDPQNTLYLPPLNHSSLIFIILGCALNTRQAPDHVLQLDLSEPLVGAPLAPQLCPPHLIQARDLGGGVEHMDQLCHNQHRYHKTT